VGSDCSGMESAVAALRALKASCAHFEGYGGSCRVGRQSNAAAEETGSSLIVFFSKTKSKSCQKGKCLDRHRHTAGTTQAQFETTGQVWCCFRR
ncbi:unnamed protein product, partial [Polarella glacialis]